VGLAKSLSWHVVDGPTKNLGLAEEEMEEESSLELIDPVDGQYVYGDGVQGVYFVRQGVDE